MFKKLEWKKGTKGNEQTKETELTNEWKTKSEDKKECIWEK